MPRGVPDPAGPSEPKHSSTNQDTTTPGQQGPVGFITNRPVCPVLRATWFTHSTMPLPRNNNETSPDVWHHYLSTSAIHFIT
jgi:hypothetical protein